MSSPTLRTTIRDYLGAWSLVHRSRKPKLVLYGNYGQGNIGDEAILRALLQIMGDVAAVTVMSREPSRVVALHGVASESTFKISGIRALLRADIVAIGGGGIFGNNMTLMPRLLPFLALVLRALGKRVVFVAIGAYVTTPPLLQRVLRLLARVSDVVTVRDSESVDVFGRQRCILVPDPGQSIDPAPADEVDRYLFQRGLGMNPTLGISLKPAVDREVDARQHEVALRSIACWTELHPDGDVLLFCFSERGNSGLGFARTDRDLATEVISGAASGTSIHVIESDVTPWLMKGIVGRCSAVVAHRLHAQMFAFDQKVPVLGLSWERKSDVFLDANGVLRLDLRDELSYDVEGWLRETVAGKASSDSM